jgi:hypothetical protein
LSGAVVPAFYGSFDGGGFVIENLTIRAADRVGLFGVLKSGASVRNLGVADVNIAGDTFVGTLAGENSGRLDNCYSTGMVRPIRDCANYLGGLVGSNQGVVTDCHSECVVEACHTTGGLMGGNMGVITNCYSTGSVRGREGTGGLTGTNDGTIANSYSFGPVSGDFSTGGLVGANAGFVTNCYSSSAVRGTGVWVGGLIGINTHTNPEHPGIVNNCYSVGTVVSTKDNVGGLVGFNDSSVTNCFWNVETSGQTDSAGGKGRTTGQMQTAVPYLGVSWDFETVWMICESKGYPRLRWEGVTCE